MADRRTIPAFLDALELDELDALQALAIPKRYPTGTTVFREGDRSDHVLIVRRGRVKIATLRRRGHEVVLAERGAGDILGELSAIDGLPRSADAVAVDDVEAWSMTTEDFATFLQTRPGAALRVLELLTARLRHADRTTIEFGPEGTGRES